MDMSDEELMQLLSQLGSTDQQLGDIDQQMAIARQLRNAPAADPTVQAGANQIVPNYAGAIDRAVQGYQGRKQEKDLGAQRQALLGQQTAGRQAYGNALLQGQQKDPLRKKLEEELALMSPPRI